MEPNLEMNCRIAKFLENTKSHSPLMADETLRVISEAEEIIRPFGSLNDRNLHAELVRLKFSIGDGSLSPEKEKAAGFLLYTISMKNRF